MTLLNGESALVPYELMSYRISKVLHVLLINLEVIFKVSRIANILDGILYEKIVKVDYSLYNSETVK
jgi:hypothetical protein